MAHPYEYCLKGYADMITDRSRAEGYVPALRRAVQPGSVVLDIGCGTGFFALLACQFGARRVYAIEPGGAIVMAREFAAANGYSDRIVFIQDVSMRATLPERVDVVVSDLHGVLPLFEQHILSIADARERLLKPGGALIPALETLWAAPVNASELYDSFCTKPWTENAYGLNMSAAQRTVVNTCLPSNLRADQLAGAPLLWATLDYRTIRDPNVGGELSWTVGRAGTAHGLAIWFDAAYDDQARISNAPGAPQCIYGQFFLPFWNPIALTAGDLLRVDLRADLAGSDYTWRWRTRVESEGGPVALKADFQQSTFFGESQSLAGLRKRDAGYRPVLDASGRVARFMLSLMDGEATLEDIARRAQQAFPAEFADFKSALTMAGDIANRFSR